MKMKNLNWGFFLYGLGSNFQLIASLSMTELFVLIAGPVLVFREYSMMKKHGVHTFFWLSVLVIFGAIVSTMANGASLYFLIRRFAAIVIVPFAIVVMHNMLRRSPNSFKWMLVGNVISLFLCTFIFQKSVEVVTTGSAVAAEITNGPIYWIQRLGPLVTLPGKGWFLNMPVWISAGGPIFMAAFCMLTSTSGRSAALAYIASAAFILIAGKKVSGMVRVQRLFWLLLIVSCIGIGILNSVYGVLAENGSLGEAAEKKYRGQTRGGKDVLHLLMGGRLEFFVGLYAACHRPILGHGLEPWDDKNYYEDFLYKYGAPEDFERYIFSKTDGAKRGVMMSRQFIPAHSCIISHWLYYGILGLLFWLYFCFLLIRYVKRDMSAVPQWYNWIACGIPGTFWYIFFSPFSERTMVATIGVACLLARAIRQRKLALPFDMQREIEKNSL